MTAALPSARSRGNARTGFAIAGIAAGMLALAFASVPLYRLFCAATGYGGTTRQAAAAPGEVGERMITVRFNADIGGHNLPWSFAPLQREVTLRVGEERLVHYRARNDGAIPVTGTATFNVTPAKAGAYFNKIDCFCFTEQKLMPGETTEFPVSFFVDPEIAKDPNLSDVTTITLSYTFFRLKGDGDKPIKTSRESAAPIGGATN